LVSLYSATVNSCVCISIVETTTKWKERRSSMKQERTYAPRLSMSAACNLLLAATVILLFSTGFALGQVAPGAYTKAVVGDHIKKVENGVDEFRKYVERRGEDAQSAAQSAPNSGAKTRRGKASGTNTEARKDQAKRTKDELDGALDDLNHSTNRLRRKFNPTSNYMETKVQMDRVMDDGRRINQIVVRGRYGTQAERYWATLRAGINDLARCQVMDCDSDRSQSCRHRTNGWLTGPVSIRGAHWPVEARATTSKPRLV
jgi:hypothetical protein